AVGAVICQPITSPSSWRSTESFTDWAKSKGLILVSGVDTRALTQKIRDGGMINAMIAHNPDGDFDRASLRKQAADLPAMLGQDLASTVTREKQESWKKGLWQWGDKPTKTGKRFHVVALDFGAKTNILRHLAEQDCRVTVVPMTTSVDEILSLKPDGIFLSNGPGDPEATGKKVLGTLKALIAANLPIFGICLGHQLLALALGGKTQKMHQGHHGANHPVHDLQRDIVEITSMNHGFSVDFASLPASVEETHRSLFDDSNCGLKVSDKPIFSVQYHPEASPGPHDSGYLFVRFRELMENHKREELGKEAETA
ncbi:hypothetical protein CAPTEDRAFT_109465, partial [Capitella teleta]